MNASIVLRSRVPLVIAAAITVAFTIACGGDDFILTGVPKADFDGSESSMVVEAAPADAAPGISSDAAAAGAMRATPRYQGGKIRQVALVRLTDHAQQPPTERIAWAVNFDPTTVPGTEPLGPCGQDCPNTKLAYALVFIDAQTGDFVFGSESSRPVD